MENLLQDKVAIITGSGQGMGKATALALAGEGAKVVTNNHKQGNPDGDAATTAHEIVAMGGQAIPVFGDVAEFNFAKDLIQTAVEHFGRLDILVNNAGGSINSRPIWEMSEADWDLCTDINFKGTFNCTRHACIIMKEQKWGRIINAASGAWLGTLHASAYGAAKGGIVGFTRSVARDLAKFGVTCNAYSPTAVNIKKIRKPKADDYLKRYEAGILTKEEYLEKMKPQPPPETVAPLILYLSTDQAANVNGQIFRVKGGKIAIFSEPTETNMIEKKDGLWRVEELLEMVPKAVLRDYNNPAPP